MRRNNRRVSRRRLVNRLKSSARQWVRGETLCALCLLVVAVWSSFQKHELDELRRERLELRAELSRQESAFEEARTIWSRESSHDRIVARAQAELGFVDASPGERMMVALPRLDAGQQENVFARMARGFDRFADVREAMARESDR